MENTCPNAEKCPIFTERLAGKEYTAKSYRVQYCEAGEENWNRCKRFMTKKKYGVCPPDLLPNSLKTVEEIGVIYKLV